MTPEQLKASILKYAMQGKLVEQKPEDGTGEDLFCKMQQVSTPNKNVTPIVEEEIPFDIPSSWKWCKFGELVDCSMGKTPPRAEPVWWQNDIHWVSISDMKDYGHISYTKEMVSQKALEEKFGGISTKGTLLMSFKLTVGRTSILDIDAVHNEAIISIYPSYRWHSVPRVQLAVIWSGIESLFNVNTEVSFRISLYIANFLGENEAQAQQIFKQVRKIYSSRSSAVHGNKTKDNLESAVEESANLLTRILRRCAELNKLPDVDNLAFRVDKQKQGIKCKILVP